MSLVLQRNRVSTCGYKENSSFPKMICVKQPIKVEYFDLK